LTVVFLHAFPLDERMWEPQRRALDGRDVASPRLYGRGRTMEAWAESIAAEIEGDVVPVGASMGGYCALALARRAPERVRGLLLVGSRPDADSDERRTGRARSIELIRREGAEGLWRDMRPKLFADESVADERLLYRDAAGLIAAVETIRDRADSTALSRSFPRPIRFVVGEHDSFVSASELQEYDVREIAGAGHLVSLERAEAFNALLTEFLDGV
jgi:pimeloyl-ACP methyl ester carboxylesterase